MNAPVLPKIFAFVGLPHDHVIVRPVLFFDELIDGAAGTGGALVVPEQFAPQSDQPAVFHSRVSTEYAVFGLRVRLDGD